MRFFRNRSGSIVPQKCFFVNLALFENFLQQAGFYSWMARHGGITTIGVGKDGVATAFMGFKAEPSQGSDGAAGDIGVSQL